MDIKTRELNHVDVISVSGRVDSAEAVHFAQALDAAYQRGRYHLVIEMSQLEYMSSAGFRALAKAQRNNQSRNRGEVILTQVPPTVHEALETVGFTDHFKIIDPLSAALEYAQNLPGSSRNPAVHS
jgi:anti-sigma B factor antagonist